MNQFKKNAFAVLLAVAVLSTAMTASAYKLATESTPEERRLAGITSSRLVILEHLLARWSLSVFTEPVHEEITNRIYGCNGVVCKGSAATSAPVPVLAGVRWNDDPPFRMTAQQRGKINCKIRETIRFETQPSCWAALFLDASKGAAQGKKYGPDHAMLYRSHFGDLQYLHAMASANGEPAAETKEKLLGWFEFTWRASRGEYTLETRLKDIDNPTIRAAYGHGEWRLLDLYTLGASGGLRRYIDEVAFGSLLHTLQDSFAGGHVSREDASGIRECSVGGTSVSAPGAILEFHAYNRQKHALHADADSHVAFMRDFQEVGNVVDIGRVLLRAKKQNLSWEQVAPFFDCIFELRRPDAAAGPGDFMASR